MSAPKRYGAYHRISQLNGRDADDNLSRADAFARIDGWAASKGGGVEVVDEYVDSDTTGSKLDRPQLDRLLADLKAGRIDGVVVAQVDRLSRADVGDALKLVAEIHELAPGGLAILDLGLDPASDTGELVLGVLLSLSRFQWKRYKRQWTVAQDKATKAGVWIGPAPLGYRRDSDGRLAVDRRAPLVRSAFEAAGAGGLHAAGDVLTAGLPGKRWRLSDVRRVLSNRAYLGEHHAGGLGHEPIVDAAVFAAAQTEPRARRSNGDYPLSHVATCAACGAGLVGAMQTVRGKSYRRMRCSQVCKGGVGSISADALEGHVRDELRVALAEVDFRVGFGSGGVDEAQAALDHAEGERVRFAQDTDAHELLGDEAWRAGLRKRADKVAEARELLGELAAQTARTVELPAADQLDDPAKFERALAVVGGLVVAPGRGAITDRVALTLATVDDLDDGAGVLAA